AQEEALLRLHPLVGEGRESTEHLRGFLGLIKSMFVRSRKRVLKVGVRLTLAVLECFVPRRLADVDGEKDPGAPALLANVPWSVLLDGEPKGRHRVGGNVD